MAALTGEPCGAITEAGRVLVTPALSIWPLREAIMQEHRFWVYFTTADCWIPATPKGAERMAVERGFEIAWGKAPPGRPGESDITGQGLWRQRHWDAFKKMIEGEPEYTWRMGSIHVEN
jgi:hypothetical protein